MIKDRSDQGPNWLSHFGPEDRTAHQKGGAENAGVEKAGAENAGAITDEKQ